MMIPCNKWLIRRLQSTSPMLYFTTFQKTLWLISLILQGSLFNILNKQMTPWIYSNRMATTDNHPQCLLHELKCFQSIMQVTSNLQNLPSVAHYNPLMACIYKIPLSLPQIKKQLRPNQIHEWLPPTISKSAGLKFNFQQSHSPTARRHSQLMRIWT